MEAPAESTWRGYSIAERDRRWAAVRKNAAEAGFDCVFVPQGNGSDAIYLTQSHGMAVVLPTDGRAPIGVSDRGSGNAWVADVRATNRAWAEPMAQALIDAGMERARIGVAGLKGGKVTHVRNADGVVNYSSFAEVRRRLPNATFEDATDVVGFARYLKGEEEIASLRHAAAIAEAGIDELVEQAQPGADLAVVYARTMGRMLDLGSQYYHLAMFADPLGAEEGTRYTNPPIGRRLRAGDYITNETSAYWGSQLAQEDQPILLGAAPAEFQRVIDLQREVFEAGLAFMKPGTAFADLIDFVNGFGAKHAGLKTLILMHGRGIGDDNGPLLSPRARGDEIRDVRIERDTTWVFKPYAMTEDERLQFVWGGDVVVTDRGAVPLYARQHGLVSIQ